MEPLDPPPPYTTHVNFDSTYDHDHDHEYNSDHTRSTIPQPSHRRSSDNNFHQLPPYWIRQYDSESHRYYFVDTSSQPPRLIWHQTYDDAIFHSASPYVENVQLGSHNSNNSDCSLPQSSLYSQNLPSHQRRVRQSETQTQNQRVPKLYRKIKDIVTNTTHEERVEARQMREQLEQEVYHRNAYTRTKKQAMPTHGSQRYGRDHRGRDVWIGAPTTHNDRMRVSTDLNSADCQSAQMRYNLNNYPGSYSMNCRLASQSASSCNHSFNSDVLHSNFKGTEKQQQQVFIKHRDSESMASALGMGFGAGIFIGGFLFT